VAKKVTLIKIFILLGNVVIPFYSFFLYLWRLRTTQGFIFFLFISAAIIERAWETFRTSKERRRDEFHGDWTLAAVTISYIVLFFAIITEFYFHVKSLEIWVVLIGVALLSFSVRMRFWGMAALGKQWAVHAVGARKIKKVRIVKIGPFRYIRHPIYLGIMTECLAFPIIAGAFYSLVLALTVCVPLVFIRALSEEQTSVRRFGDKYLTYRKEVGMFLPTQFFRRV